MPAKLFTSRDAAERLGCTKMTVSRLARSLRVGTTIGQARVFTAAEIATLAQHVRKAPGNPNFVAKEHS